MATCRECICEDVCSIKNNVLCQLDTFVYEEYSNMPNVEKYCERFKSKSDYVKRECGEWVFVCTYKHTNYYRCSRCTRVYPIFNNTRFCQHCAADMRKEDNNE